MVNSVASAAFALRMSAGLAERRQNHLSKKKEKTRRETRGETSAGTRRNQEIMMEQTPFFEQREETRRKTRSETRRETRAGTRAGTRRNQEIMMEQNPFPEQRKQRKKRQEGRQAPEPERNQEKPGNHDGTDSFF